MKSKQCYETHTACNGNTCRFDTRKVGAKGFYGEFPATVYRICEWSDSLVEVYVPGGLICVSIKEITTNPR